MKQSIPTPVVVILIVVVIAVIGAVGYHFLSQPPGGDATQSTINFYKNGGMSKVKANAGAPATNAGK